MFKNNYIFIFYNTPFFSKLCENDRLYSMSGPRTSSMSASEVSPVSHLIFKTLS